MPRPAMLAGLLLTIGAVGAPLAAQTAVRIDTALAVPMRDGVVLRADLYRPAGEGRFPTLVHRTQKSRGELTPDPLVTKAVQRGYAVLLQDVRGRYGSDGTFDPYRQEGRDGYDTIEWAARQPWSSGAVGTFGLSYPGAVQWLAAIERPPSLRAMVPAMTFSSPESFWYSGGVWDGSWLDWTWLNIAPDLRRRLGLAGPQTDEEAARAWDRDGAAARRFVPRLELPPLQGATPFYYEWMRHPPGDAWWDFARLAGRYDRVGAAVLNLSGWFDEMYGPSGAVENHVGLVAAGKRTALVLGPWTHGVASTQRSKAGERDFGAAAALDYDATVLDWMDRHLKKAELTGRSAEIRVFVMGINRWRTFDRWPLAANDTLYLVGGRGTRDLGRLSPSAPARVAGETVLRSDPARPVRDPFDGSFGAHDYRALTPGPGVAVFETAPLTEPLEIAGRVIVELAVSASVPDFDLWVQLFDVAPDGTSWNLSTAGTALQRASYRDGGPVRSLVKRGETVRLRMNEMVTANRFLPGHRLRVVVTPSFAPLFSINPQTGAQEFESDSVRAGEIRIGGTTNGWSRIILPRVSISREER